MKYSVLFLTSIKFLLRGAGHVCLNLNFLVKFPIGLHMILKTTDKKIQNLIESDAKIILTGNPLRCSLAPLLK